MLGGPSPVLGYEQNMFHLRFTRTMLWLSVLALAADGIAATDVKVNFTLNTTDAYGVPIQEQRYYYLYRPDNLPRTNPLPMVLFMEDTPASPPASSFHRIADQAGFLMISCSFSATPQERPEP